MRRYIILSILMLAAISTAGIAQERTELFPPTEPYETGMLRVSELHEIYWEKSGNPDGIPLILLHGGPGVGVSPGLRRMVDPDRYHIIGFDQRGCGKSTPFFEWRENTTDLLIDDINTLREHLNIKDKAVLWGLSWGTTLGLAYAEKHPENVAGIILIGVFTCRQNEIDFLYHGGAGAFYPENFERFRALVPEPDVLEYPRQLFEIISGDDRDLAKTVIDATAYYEVRMVALNRTDEQAWKAVNSMDLSAFALLSTYYISNGCFLDKDQLLRDATRIADIPVYISNGNQDAVTPPMTAYELSKRLRRVKLDIVPGASHNDMGVFISAIKGCDWIAEQIAGD
jgi:proline iminopeptidase